MRMHGVCLQVYSNPHFVSDTVVEMGEEELSTPVVSWCDL